MINYWAKEIANAISGDFFGTDIKISGVSTDSRNINQGDLFVAIQGENFDGNKFVESAIESGLSCVLVNKKPEISCNYILVKDTVKALGLIAKYHRSHFNPKIVAITGSSGKTTTRNMLTSIVKCAGMTLSPEKNYNNEIGLPKTLLKLNSNHEFVVLEMGAARPGDIKYLMDLASPNITAVTNIGPAHLETMGGLDGVANTKSEIYESLAEDDIAVVNVNDIYAPFMLTKIKANKIITVGLELSAEISAKNIKLNSDKNSFTLITDIGEIDINLSLLGSHNISNALIAVGCARALGINLQNIKKGLDSVTSEPRRLYVVDGVNSSKIIDDSYNSNPVSVKAAIEVLISDNNKNKIFVLADMAELGENEAELHAMLGESMSSLGVQKLYTLGNLAKLASENFNGNSKHFSNKQDLVNHLKKFLDKDTTVLVKGSNFMKMDEVVNNLK